MAAYDVDAMVKALEKPTVKINGKTHEGRLLSVQQAAKFDERWSSLFQGEPDGNRVYDFCKDYLYAVFPKPVIPWHIDVAKEVMNSPVFLQVVIDFFRVTKSAFVGSPSDPVTNGTK
jgi:hypothetical protein